MSALWHFIPPFHLFDLFLLPPSAYRSESVALELQLVDLKEKLAAARVALEAALKAKKAKKGAPDPPEAAEARFVAGKELGRLTAGTQDSPCLD